MESDDDGPPLLIDTRDVENCDELEASPAPVTIVTGYLGSGKSTLLKYISKTHQHKRIAIVLNEFGQTSDIERSMAIRNQNSDGIEVEQWVELDNGCMCCTAKDAGVSAIEKLMEREGRYDHIIIETSGVADPAPIANLFWLDDALMAKVKLDGIVTVVDARTIMRSLDEGALASIQIACADIVLINKCDTVSDDDIMNVASRVREINGAAELVKCTFGEISADKILNINAYSSNGAISVQSFTGVHGTSGPSHSHANHDLSTVVIPLHPNQFESLADVDSLESKLQHLLWTKKLGDIELEVHRAKGKFNCGQGTDHPVTKIIQGVRETYEITNVQYEPDAESKLVLIGKNLFAVKPQLLEMFKKI